MATQASCPSCGTFLTIAHQSTVSVVCKRCHAVLEYQAGALRQVGSAAVVVPTRASVQVGEEGAYNGTGFQITGHVQLANEDGATWDEYYLGFSDGQCGWLAQAQGRLILSFRAPFPEGAGIPDFEDLELNQKLQLMAGLPGVNVVEKGQARVEAANGQMPYLLRPGETYPYADFAAMNGGFASLDYSTEPPDLFVGREVTFDDLQMRARRSEPTEQRGNQAPMVCTECGTSLEVRSSRSERITCLKCRAVFDITSGRPNHVGSQEDSPVRPIVPVGSKVTFGPQEYVLSGFIQKATDDEQGVTYNWQEYLLADDQGGYRWLVQDSDGHWSLFESITGGSEIQPVVSYGGRNYKFYQHGEARIVYLEGEFYWNAAVGQTAYLADFVAPPNMLAAEFASADSTKGETSWTHGVYLPVADVRKALGSNEVPRPRGVAPNQPFPHKGILPIWLISTVAAIGLCFLFQTSIQPHEVKKIQKEVPDQPEADLKPPPGLPPDVELIQQFQEKIKLVGGKNIRIRASADLRSTFLEINGFLDPDDNEKREEPIVQPFAVPIEFYTGVDEENAPWTSGDRESAAYLSALPEGDYTLHIQVYRKRGTPKNPAQPFGGFGGINIGGVEREDPPFLSRYTIYVEQGYPRIWPVIWACLALAVIPLIVWLMWLSFERRRWANSNVTPSGA